MLLDIALIGLGGAAFAAWLYLAFLHGGFWRADQRLSLEVDRAPKAWPEVVVVVPARNEATVIARSLTSLLDQTYPGVFSVVLVDDGSTDGTSAHAQTVAAAHPQGVRLRAITAPPLPAGWVGKMWALHCGLEEAARLAPQARYWLLTDADVAHHPGALRRLVGKAEAEELHLVSLMVRLSCVSGWERLLIPAFVYFFQQLYPFPWVNDPHARSAAAAGGTMLARRFTLEAAGGVAAVRDAVIDDCALARCIKRHGPVWLGLTRHSISLRPYAGLGDIWEMVARSAYTQLRHAPTLLAGTVLGLGLVYLVPPLLVLLAPLHQSSAAILLGAAAWLLMTVTFIPTLRLYRRSRLLALALPLAAFLYLGMTLDSARRHYAKRTRWKGRVLDA